MPSLTKYRFAIPLIVVALALAVVGINQSATAQAKEEPKPGSKLTLTVEGVEYTFCYIPAGTFMMGSPESEKGRGAAEKLHKVIISKGFYMLENEVTQEQFGKEPDFKDSVRTGSHFRGAKLPVEDRGFHEANYSKFAKALMKATGRKIRLPTEAEWEYACRAGTTTPFNCGNDMDSTLANMNGREPYGQGVKSKYLNKTMDVKQFKPNAWGLYDMHGNVAEVCVDYAPKEADLYVEGITDPGAADPAAIEVKNTASLVNGLQPRLSYRGGCYWSTGNECRSASHEPIADSRNGADFLGFRLVLIP